MAQGVKRVDCQASFYGYEHLVPIMFFKCIACFLFLLLGIVVTVKASDEFQQLYDSAKRLRSVPLAELSLEVAKKLKDYELIGRAYFLMAYYQQHSQAYYEGLNNYFSAYEYYRKSRNIERQISTLINIGIIYAKGGFHEKSIKYYQRGIRLAREDEDIANELRLRYQVARAFQLMKLYPEARKIYSALIPQFQALDNEKMVSRCYLSLGYIVATSGGSCDSADYYYSKAVEAFDTEGQNKNEAKMKKKNSLAYVLIKKGSYEKAKKLLLLALDQSHKDTFIAEIMVNVYFNLGDVYQHLGVTDSAIIMYEKGIEYIDVEDFDFDYVQNAKLLYDFCRKFDPIESEACSQVIYEFTEEVVEFKERLVDANAHYQVAAADYRHQNELLYVQQQQNQRLINIMIFVALGLIILAGLIFYLYERKRRIQQWRKVLKELTVRPRFTDP